MTSGVVIWRQKSLTIYYWTCLGLCFCYRSSPHRHLSKGCHCNFCVIDEEVGQCIWSPAQQTSWGSHHTHFLDSMNWTLFLFFLKKKETPIYLTINATQYSYFQHCRHILPCLDPSSIGRRTVSLAVLPCRGLCLYCLSLPLSPLCFHLGLGCDWNLGLLPQSFCCCYSGSLLCDIGMSLDCGVP